VLRCNAGESVRSVQLGNNVTRRADILVCYRRASSPGGLLPRITLAAMTPSVNDDPESDGVVLGGLSRYVELEGAGDRLQATVAGMTPPKSSTNRSSRDVAVMFPWMPT